MQRGEAPAMLGGGLGRYAPGQWSDDTEMAAVIACVAATGAPRPRWTPSRPGSWSGTPPVPADIGNQTAAVLGGATGSNAADLRDQAARVHERTGRSAGNGSLMRTAPVALALGLLVGLVGGSPSVRRCWGCTPSRRTRGWSRPSAWTTRACSSRPTSPRWIAQLDGSDVEFFSLQAVTGPGSEVLRPVLIDGRAPDVRPAVRVAFERARRPSVSRVSIRLGYQIPNYSYGSGVAELFGSVVAQAREAEDAGFDAVFVMDHLYQLPGLGTPDQPMLECYSTLAALAASTSRIQLSSLVTGNTYRNPTLLAKTVTTLDVISQGRAVLGIGAGWFELEHQQLGFEFGTFTERFEKLDEALAIIAPMLHGERPSLDGKWYRAETAMNEPRIRDDLPIMLGGGGERKTFALAARYAQHLNIICDPADLPRKLAALDERCAEVGRDRASIETSFLGFAIVDEDGDRARTLQRDYLRGIGVDLDSLDDEQRTAATSRHFVGTPDDVAADFQKRVLDPGVDGLLINMIPNGHEPGAITAAGRALNQLLGR